MRKKKMMKCEVESNTSRDLLLVKFVTQLPIARNDFCILVLPADPMVRSLGVVQVAQLME
ncbi:hypothetical protein CL635_02880 [bacterium]|nr:hypothetical protein [bacterium]